jgi:TolB-like protein
MQRPTLPISAAAGPSPQSILVLPFTGPGGDAALDSLAGMLSGDVARLLANSLRDATIVAGAAAKDKSADERTLAKEANVRYLVAGDVRVVGEDIAVTARLIDGTTAKQLASERRTIARARATEDQDLLVRRITAAARLMFQNAEGRRLAAEPLVATDARSLVARADAIFTEEDLASTRAARQLYEQARERDPSLMGAWIGHMYTLVSELWNDFAGGRDPRLLAEIDRDSRRAVELDARDPQAWFARADALQNQWQWQAESEAYDRAAALDPSRFNSRAGLYILSGRSAEALRQIEKRNALEGGPDSATLFGACHAYIHLGRYEEALSQCERAVASDNFYWLYLDLIAAYAETGDMARAAAAKDQLLKRVPDFTISRLLAKQFSNNPVWSEEIRTRFVPGWRKAGLPE